MHLETERRSNGPSRFPVDLLVELSHDGDEAVFEADAMDLGPSGIGLRASVLPEIGQRLRCRFELPGQYELCETRGEVVWAEDTGPHRAAFGLRFEDVDPATARALEALAPPSSGSDSRLVSMRLDGVESAIEGEIVSEGGVICVEQSMPFLQIGRGATLERGRSSMRVVLERVRLRVVDGTPRLAMELSPLDAIEMGRVPDADATIQDEPLEALVAPSSRAEREAPRVVRRAEAVGPNEGASHPTPSLEAAPSLEARLRVLADGAKLQLAKARISARAMISLGVARAIPWLGRMRDGIMALWRLFASWVAQRAPRLGTMLGQAPRRRTAVPTAAARVAPQKRARNAAPVVVPAPPLRLRTILLIVLVIAAVGFMAYGLASGAEEPAALEIHPATTTTASATPAPASSLAAPVTVPETIEPIAPPSPSDSVPAAAPLPMPGWDRAMPEPVSAAGPIPAPTYPSLQDRRSGAASTAIVEAAPSSAPLEFGAPEVPRGRTTTLRMSAPVQGIEGQADEGGFTITIRGALSLDRAAPLAAASSSIERASIINRGDHAVLTIRFVTGRTPAYRVVAHDTSLDITIGR